MKIINDWKKINFDEIARLYESVGWSTYTKDINSLKIAFENSTLVNLAVNEEGKVIGLTRSISDKVSIHYLQDIIVDPSYQRKGVGRKLLDETLEYFKEVRTHMILTDDEEKQLLFYSSLGFKNTKDLREMPLNTFVKMKDIDLK
jgi:ribosomal protein S18 acetylase RimI-like enzyme